MRPTRIAVLSLGLLACSNGPAEPTPTLANLQGTWRESTCQFRGTMPPYREEDCLGLFPDSLVLAIDGGWVRYTGTPAGEDPNPPTSGTLAISGAGLTAEYSYGPAFDVQVTANLNGMIWVAPTTYNFTPSTPVEPATLTFTWVRDP